MALSMRFSVPTGRVIRSIALAAVVATVVACGGSVDVANEESPATVPAGVDQSGRVSRLAISAANACSAPANAVVAENCLLGSASSEWDVSGDGDSSIQGFSTDISFNRGETAAFKINSDARAYRIDIYRLGYYSGAGARRVATIFPSVSLPQTQPPCLSDASTGLVDCGNWAVSATWAIPASAVSGVYVAKLTRTDTGGASHIKFVVRDDASRSDLLFQTSDTTWQAYNTYGGNSFYVGQPAGRAYKLSYNRPLLGRGDPYHGFFANEYPMIRWLEANGYDVSYTTGVDTHRRGDLIKNHKVFLSVGHDEYWSGTQRANVEAARNAGVSLAFFSGNSIYWKTRWEPSVDGSNTAYRTLVSYKETWANAKIDPSPEWTGTWRDPRFSPPADGGRPENALQGTFWVVNCCVDLTSADYTVQVPAEMGRMRLWRNTGLQNLSPGQTATLTPGILGFEWDTDADNGFRPPGLIRLSQATYDVSTMILDYGSTVGPGRVTHYLTLYRHASGALVFGAGTTRWSWGLDDNHDGSGTPVDFRIRQATVNLFADMGVQPYSMQPGLVVATASTDVTAPTASIVQPAAGTSVAARSTLTISGTAVDGGGVVAGVEVSLDGGQTWRPANGRGTWSYPWKPETTGSVTLMARAIDDSGNIQSPPAAVTVTVLPPECPCTIWESVTVPRTASVADRNSVELGIKFSVTMPGHITGVRFYKGPQNTGTHVGNLWTANGQLLATATFAGETASGWQQVNFASPVYVKPGTIYVASYHAPNGGYAVDQNYFQSGLNAVPFNVPANSITANGLYAYGPTTRFPTNSYQASNYWVDAVFVPTSVTTNDDTFSVGNGRQLSIDAPGVLSNDSDANGSALTATKVTDPQFGTLVLNANGSFTYTPLAGFFGTDSFTYRATAANGQSAVGTVSLTINQDGCPCSVFPSSSMPAVVSASDTGAVQLGMKFSSTVPGYVTGVRFYKGPANTGTHVGNLWTASGQLLASATFTTETATGWQQVLFDTPVAIAANTTYVVSYFAPQGGYSYTSGFFSSGVNSNILVAPDSASSGGNGVYAYGSANQFPNQTYQAANYWVDVSFSPVSAGADRYTSINGQTLSVAAPGVLANDAEVNGAALSAATFSGPSFGVLTLNADGSFTYVPQPGFSGVDSFTYRAMTPGGQFAVGRVSITVTSPSAVYSVFSSGATPAVESVVDGSVNLGVKFMSTVPGYVVGVRFYKGSGNTGTHVGSLWSASGELLATATFVNENASGWQQVNFSTPIAISPNTVYVVSYLAPNGGYAFSGGFFGSAVVTDILRAPASDQVGGNGVYAYGSANTFPSQSWNSGNYWVDVLFKTSP
jgi:VCBS repeat-containing protein